MANPIGSVNILIVAALAGWTISDFPKKYLDILSTPLAEFFIYMFVLYEFRSKNGVTLWTVMIEAAVLVIIVETIQRHLKKIDI